MSIISQLLVLVGLFWLLAAVVPARKIYQLTRSSSWKILSLLIFGFVIGYICVLIALFINQPNDLLIVALAVILLCGGVFVSLVVSNSFDSLLKLQKLADAERTHSVQDTLTGIPNRKYFVETINTLISKNEPFDVMLFDVVNFKQINDGMGHYYGDQCLIQLGHRISMILSPHDFLARVGGDEFVLLIPNSNDLKSAALATQIHQQLREAFNIDGFQLTISVTIGVSRFPHNGQTTDHLLNAADLAMYHSKHTGQLLTVYEPSMEQGPTRQLEISQKLDYALKNHELRVFYQPIINGRTLEVDGYEALIRWHASDGEQFSPNDFIGVAEKSHQITRITHWLLNKVASDLSQFSENGVHLPVHVNLSAKDLIGTKLVDQLSQLIQSHPILNQRLILEITESVAINRLHHPKQLFSKLQQLGFRISLDDFGTGFSSLSLLRDLPVNQLKIDRSFITHVCDSKKDLAIVQNIISLAHGLGHNVVAEGIDSLDTVKLLRSLECDLLQGFYFSKARPLEEAIVWTLHYKPQQLAVPTAFASQQ